jgi:hypothetical protein
MAMPSAFSLKQLACIYNPIFITTFKYFNSFFQYEANPIIIKRRIYVPDFNWYFWRSGPD